MASSFGPIQEAIYDTLTGDATLLSLVTGVFDFVPENQDYPYVVIGEGTSVDWSTYQHFGEENTATIHIFSRYNGMLEMTDIMSQINALLVFQPLTITDYENVGIWYDFGNVFIEDHLTRHGVMRFRFLVLTS